MVRVRACLVILLIATGHAFILPVGELRLAVIVLAEFWANIDNHHGNVLGAIGDFVALSTLKLRA